MTARRSSRLVRSRVAQAVLSLAALLTAASPAVGGGVECDRTKKYPVHKNCGPWMIMVAAIHPLRGGNDKGMTPAEAADQVVYDLREQGIPAYTYEVDTETASLSTRSRDGSEQERLMATMRGGVCVLAGSFPSADDDRTTRALKFIKHKAKCPTLEPEAATDGTVRTKTGGFFKLPPGRPRSPLTRAFVTVNPLLDAGQVQQLRKIRDPLLTRLNSGEEYSLHKCPGAYSVVVKEFRGKTLTQVSGTKSADVGERVDVSGDLNDAGREAWELCQILRNREKKEAYVWHDRYRSIVTVGSFSSPKDPAAVRTAQQFAAKSSVGNSGLNGFGVDAGAIRTAGHYAAETGAGADSPMPMLISVPKGETDIRKAERYWLLEVSPYAMPVPRM